MLKDYKYQNKLFGHLFPNSAAYRMLRESGTGEIREGGPRRSSLPFSERHLQCVWYNPNLRPKKMKTVDGEEIEVLDPGRWNLESGPDFLGAVLETASSKRRIQGDIEIHVDPADWIAHKHRNDPRYANLCAHVTFFNAPLPADKLPASVLQLSLKKSLMSNPYFSFEDIDTAAYPHDLQAKRSPCAKIIAKWDKDKKTALLKAAGEERLRRKSEEFSSLVTDCGLDQAIYIKLMRALGYKRNASGFGYIAEQLPVVVLREESKGDQLKSYAILMGIGNMLPSESNSNWDHETSTFIKTLWSHWWRLRDKWEPVAINPQCWNKSGLRPQNRIERRMMAAASLFGAKKPIWQKWRELNDKQPKEQIISVMDSLTSVDGGYWNHRLAWSGPRQSRPISIIGRARASVMVANVFIPFASSTECLQGDFSFYSAYLPSEPLNSVVRECANLLFSPSHPRSIYREEIARQGLMQIFHDFCIQDSSGCRECKLPELLRSSWQHSS